MAAETVHRPQGSAGDPADVVARVAGAKRAVLLRAHRRRLGFEDLEDCYSQATLELIARAREGRPFQSDLHVARALEQKFVSRINDRARALGGRSPIEAALREAASLDDQDAGVTVLDARGQTSDQVAARDQLRRITELARELTDDQRLVLACQVSLEMERGEFCQRFGWSHEKFRKTAQRARAHLRTLTSEYDGGERCRRLAADVEAHVAGVASAQQSERVLAHLANCPACARGARELELATREVAALLPVPALAKLGLLGKLTALAAGARQLLPWSGGGGSATAAATGGGAAVAGSSGSMAGLAGAKLGAVLCVAGLAGGYAVCEQAGLLPAPAIPHRAQPAARGEPAKTSAPPRTTIVGNEPARRVIVASSGTSHASSHSTPRPGTETQTRREFGIDGRAHVASSRAPQEPAHRPAPPPSDPTEFGFE